MPLWMKMLSEIDYDNDDDDDDGDDNEDGDDEDNDDCLSRCHSYDWGETGSGICRLSHHP